MYNMHVCCIVRLYRVECADALHESRGRRLALLRGALRALRGHGWTRRGPTPQVLPARRLDSPTRASCARRCAPAEGGGRIRHPEGVRRVRRRLALLGQLRRTGSADTRAALLRCCRSTNFHIHIIQFLSLHSS